jgi:hypothetical protein
MAPSPTPLHCHSNAVELEEEVGALHACEGVATVRFGLINQNEGHFEAQRALSTDSKVLRPSCSLQRRTGRLCR